jgi:phosphate:Na+ symporter
VDVPVGLVISILLNVLGGLGLFLLGMKNMSEGMQAIAGARLRRLIAAVTDNRYLAVCVGTLITCVVQSSSVTTVMVVGLVNSGFMTLMQAIGVIFGANIGTTITGWILVLKIGKYGLPIMGAAALVFLFSKNDRIRYTGMTVMGIGMIFFGLELMSSGFKPLRTMPEFVQWFHTFQATSYLGVLKCALAGCVLTMIVQSSSATLGITIGLAESGLIPFETAAALVLGENIGTTITAYLASLGAGTNAKRAAYSHMVFNVLGVLWITAIFAFYIVLIRRLLPNDPNFALMADGDQTFPYMRAGIALVHTVFNVTNTIIFLPFISLIATFVTRIVPDREKRKEKFHLTYLDVRMLNTPSLGMAQSKEEILMMARGVERMLVRLRQALATEEADESNERKIFQREEILDNIQKEVTVFLGKLVAGNVSQEASTESHRQLRMADEYESLSDEIAAVLKMYIKLRRNNLKISQPGREAILDLHDRVATYVKTVTNAVEQEDGEILSRARSDGIQITNTAKNHRDDHLARLSRQEVDPLKSLMFIDILNAYRRIKEHGLNIAETLAGET